MTRTVALAGGTQIPLVGLGTWPMDDTEARRVVATSIELGYRHLDTAENYANERGVGDGLRDSGIDRAQVWVTTKFNKRWHGVELVEQAVRGSLDRLGLDYLDLVLIHWPNPAQDRYVQAWEGLIRAREQGLVRAIGTSNFTPTHLERLIDATGVAPEVNQLELHPYFDRTAERAFQAAHGIVTEAWSPLGRGNGLLDEPLVTATAGRLGVTPAQVILAWDVVQGIVTIPKSSDPARLAQNLDVFDVMLSGADVAGLTALTASGIEPMDPERFGH
jgi:2,5-diketo-D-gluconate reductase A